MYFNPEGRTLYPANWEYNGCRIIKALERIIYNHGGVIEHKSYNHGFIENRTLAGAVADLETRAGNLRNALETGKSKNPDITTAALEKCLQDLEDVRAIDNSPIEIYNGLYIRFYIDNIYYSIELNDNPFFDFYYTKTPIKNNKRSRDAVGEILDKSNWLYDCFFGYKAADGDCIEAANIIFNQVMNAKNSTISRDSSRERVPNRYNDGYHFETILKPERFETIDF